MANLEKQKALDAALLQIEKQYGKGSIKNGIIQGVTETQFVPQSAVTRQQAATIFHRFVRLMNADNGLREHEPFADEGQISDFALDAAHWAAANGIFVGDNQGNLNPQGSATRAQSVTVLMRLDRYLQTISLEEPLT